MQKEKITTQDQYLEHVDQRLVPDQNSFVVEQHRPTPFRSAFHHHASVEVNFLIGCDLEYSFSGKIVRVPRHRMTVFWGAVPHSVTEVFGKGEIVNLYISLARLLQLGVQDSFIEAIIGGSVISAKSDNDQDIELFKRWASDYKKPGTSWSQLILGELEMRFRRLALEGHETLMEGASISNVDVSGGETMRHIDAMLRYIADCFGSPITVTDVANHVGLSPSYAMSLFRRAVGVPIKEHITRIRLSHAQMLLANTDKKIISAAMDSGFGSLSSFYEAFQMHMHTTPAAFRRESRH